MCVCCYLRRALLTCRFVFQNAKNAKHTLSCTKKPHPACRAHLLSFPIIQLHAGQHPAVTRPQRPVRRPRRGQLPHALGRRQFSRHPCRPAHPRRKWWPRRPPRPRARSRPSTYPRQTRAQRRGCRVGCSDARWSAPACSVSRVQGMEGGAGRVGRAAGRWVVGAAGDAVAGAAGVVSGSGLDRLRGGIVLCSEREGTGRGRG